MADDHEYHGADGNTTALNSADSVALAVSDLSRRILALETAPHPATAEGGTSGAEIDRLKAVLGPYFGNEFLAYDREHDAAAAADAEKGTGTAN